MVFAHSSVQLIITKLKSTNYDGARNVKVSLKKNLEIRKKLFHNISAGRCRKNCGAANIDSIQSAQKLRGCTHIDGSLEIQIRSQGGRKLKTKNHWI
jgi:hypothetical protein